MSATNTELKISRLTADELQLIRLGLAALRDMALESGNRERERAEMTLGSKERRKKHEALANDFDQTIERATKLLDGDKLKR